MKLPGSGAAISVIGQGTWQLERSRRKDAVRALRAGIDAGMTHIDTAEMYGGGKVETLVGEALEGRREQVFLASKVLPKNASRTGTPLACEASLRRLRTDRLDLYLLHWPGSHPLEETVSAFEKLAREGKIRAWGVSNFDERELADLLTVAGEGRVACNQVLYHLAERSIEHAVLPLCRDRGIPVVGYSPFGSGAFPRSGRSERRLLDRIAAAHGVEAHQVALAFLTRHASTASIPRTADAGHARANARAGSLRLSADEVRQIDGAFPRGPHRSGVPML